MTRRPDRSTNAAIAELLRALAGMEASPALRKTYRDAAASIEQLREPLTAFARPDGTMAPIEGVGRAAATIVADVLLTGRSEAIERAAARNAGRQARPLGPKQYGSFLSADDVARILADTSPTGVTRDDYRGDLQMHSTYSDGSQSLDDIATTGIARGYAYAAVTDHGYGLPVAHGVSMERLADQHRAIDRLNAQHAGAFRIIKGIEANIRADGSIDMTRDELRRLEIVVAAPHSALRSNADQTTRMVAAARAPGVHILGHPRGRKRGVRDGLRVNWDRVFEAAAKTTVAIEIDGDPRRQDLDHVLARRALDAGCLIALDSDAHATDEWMFAETAIAHARLAGIPAERIINCWPLEFLLEWARGLQRR